MEIYTIQMAKWRRAKALNIPFLDITVKSGVKSLAPKWDMLMKYKRGEVGEEEYTNNYLFYVLAETLDRKPEVFDKIFSYDKIALACYCRAGAFCHRHILAGFLEALGKRRNIEVKIMPEIE